MSRIREEAKAALYDPFNRCYHWTEVDDNLARQARRVLLLERAYRYQRAAFRKSDLANVIGDADKAYMLIRGPRGAWADNAKASALYSEAESI